MSFCPKVVIFFAVLFLAVTTALNRVTTVQAYSTSDEGRVEKPGLAASQSGDILDGISVVLAPDLDQKKAQTNYEPSVNGSSTIKATVLPNTGPEFGWLFGLLVTAGMGLVEYSKKTR